MQSFAQPQTGGGLGSLFGGGGGGAADLFGGAGAGAAGGAGFNIGQLKTIVDRLGGIEGIVSTFGKVQQVVQSVSQVAPMLKPLMNSFAKRKTDSSDGDGLAPVRRRRRKRRKSTVQGKRRTRK
ncbi:hypothetical protein LJK87_44290 [Paenibacillus sp. P25]|nr:hypothetical protein LJK87_44290 [Paenibacillus sp. P25]